MASLTAGEGQAGFARFRAILHLRREVSIQTQAAGQWDQSLVGSFESAIGGRVSEILLEKRATVTC